MMSKFDKDIKRLTQLSIEESLAEIGVEMNQKFGEISDVAKSQFELLFPFTIRAHEVEEGAVHNPYNFRDAFIEFKPKDMSWYAFDVTIKSPIHLRFTAYGMRSNMVGGIGKRLGEFDGYVKASLTAASIENRIKAMAEDRRRTELELAEAKIIRGYADELRSLLKNSNVKAV